MAKFLIFIFLSILTCFFSVSKLWAGAYIFAGDSYGINVVTHPKGYTGTGGNLIVTVGIDPSATKTTELETSIKNNINIWNELLVSTGNLKSGSNNEIASNQLDFESVALHEVGHCLGLAHVNLSSESGLSEPNRNYTKSTTGVNGIYDLNSGSDSTIGSSDDQRGDDTNLVWYKKSDNNPFTIASNVSFSTYTREIADLPSGHSYIANGDRNISSLLGASNTEAVMQQGTYFDETQRTLSADDVATIKLAELGKDRISGSADDYTIELQYVGITSSADLVIHFEDISGLAFCSTSGQFIASDHVQISSANLYFDNGYNWYFNTVSNQTPLSECRPEAITIQGSTYTDVHGSVVTQSEISITTEQDVNINNGAQVTYQAPVITLKPGFHAVSGSQFIVQPNAVSCSGETLTSKRNRDASSENHNRVPASDVEELSFIHELKNPTWLKQSELPIALQDLLSRYDAQAMEAQMDGDGIGIVFSSDAQLLDIDLNSYSDVYFYDILGQKLSLVSRNINQIAANAPSDQARINETGEYIVYRSAASDISAHDSNQVVDIYLYNLLTLQTKRVSWQLDGGQTRVPSSYPSIAGVAPYVVYESGDESVQHHIYGTDLKENTVRISKYSLDTDINGNQIENHRPAISSDGKFLTYVERTAHSMECNVHLYELTDSDYLRIPCPVEFYYDSDLWVPQFSGSGESIIWYHSETSEQILIFNPLHN